MAAGDGGRVDGEWQSGGSGHGGKEGQLEVATTLLPLRMNRKRLVVVEITGAAREC